MFREGGRIPVWLFTISTIDNRCFLRYKFHFPWSQQCRPHISADCNHSSMLRSRSFRGDLQNGALSSPRSESELSSGVIFILRSYTKLEVRFIVNEYLYDRTESVASQTWSKRSPTWTSWWIQLYLLFRAWISWGERENGQYGVWGVRFPLWVCGRVSRGYRYRQKLWVDSGFGPFTIKCLPLRVTPWDWSSVFLIGKRRTPCRPHLGDLPTSRPIFNCLDTDLQHSFVVSRFDSEPTS